MNEMNAMRRPETIRSRTDAVQLCKHLLARGISFHWEDDPQDWVDATGESAHGLRGRELPSPLH